MALPGLSLPGLSSTPSARTSVAPPPFISAPPRVEQIPPRAELRFEVAFNKTFKVKLLRGTAEIFGTELALNIVYTFTGCAAAVFTWEGCSLELQGEPLSEYVGTETDAMVEWLNAHGMIDTLRDTSKDGGPRVLILGSDSCGKSSLAKCLVAWGLKAGRSPTYVNLDPQEGGLSVPSALTATTYVSQMDIESSDWGQSAISGPISTQSRSPVVYHYPFPSPTDSPDLYKAIATRLALAVTSKLEQDPRIKPSGFIVDTPSALNRPQDSYDLALHLISEFSITLVLTLGSERLHNDIARRFPPNSGPDAPVVLRLSASPGAVTRDATFLRSHRAAQIRAYFFGTTTSALNPHSQTVPFSELAVFRATDPAAAGAAIDFLPGQDDGDDEDDYNPAPGPLGRDAFEKVEPSQALLNAVAAVKYAAPTAGQAAIRDAPVMGFVYIAEVDETRKRVRFLAPHPGRWGDLVLVVGRWPEGVGDLVS